MEENIENIEKKGGKLKQNQMAGAIVIAGLLIAGAILLKPQPVLEEKTESGSILIEIAKSNKLNINIFNKCLIEGKYSEKISNEISEGEKAGVRGTPHSFILYKGKVVDIIEGAQPLERVEEKISKVSINFDKGNQEQIMVLPISEEDHIIGNKEAEIIIIGYSDFDCPFCKVFHNTMHQLIEKNTNVVWVYRHFPIKELHPEAKIKANASECAWEQGGNDAFWKYADAIFSKK